MATFETVEDYLASLPDQSRSVVEKVAQRVAAAAPDAAREIRYDVPTWLLHGASLVHVAAMKDHVGLYPAPPPGDPALDRDLAPYAGEMGTLKFPYDGVPYDLVERAVRRLRELRG
jgi:uncharacterized protein YdhG (YjbR/CyaY superfamily)